MLLYSLIILNVQNIPRNGQKLVLLIWIWNYTLLSKSIAMDIILQLRGVKIYLCHEKYVHWICCDDHCIVIFGYFSNLVWKKLVQNAQKHVHVENSLFLHRNKSLQFLTFGTQTKKVTDRLNGLIEQNYWTDQLNWTVNKTTIIFLAMELYQCFKMNLWFL